jgi:uncharacterized protein DUF2760
MKETAMHQRARGSAALVVIVVLAGIALAVANVVVLLTTASEAITASSLVALYDRCPACVLYFIVAPLTVTLVFAVLVRRTGAGTSQPTLAAAAREDRKAVPAPPSPAAALRLLALLQQEGRFIDFIQEDIDAYSDAQVGAAVRSIHAGCRKALDERIELERVLADEDGSEVVVEPGFDPAAVRLTGNVTGEPPFRGTLQHGGWRATKVTLPQSPGGVESNVIAPAEVEIG